MTVESTTATIVTTTVPSPTVPAKKDEILVSLTSSMDNIDLESEPLGEDILTSLREKTLEHPVKKVVAFNGQTIKGLRNYRDTLSSTAAALTTVNNILLKLKIIASYAISINNVQHFLKEMDNALNSNTKEFESEDVREVEKAEQKSLATDSSTSTVSYC